MIKVEFIDYTGIGKSGGICHMDSKEIKVPSRLMANKVIIKEREKGSTWGELHIWEVIR